MELNHSELEVQLPETKTVIVEIGHGDRSLAQFADIKFTDGLSYIGIDMPAEYMHYFDIDFSHRLMPEHRKDVPEQRPGENISFVTGDARNLPLRPQSVDTVFLANLIDGPARMNEKPFLDKMVLSLHEALKPGGTIVVFEDRTPTPRQNEQLGHNPTVRQFKLLGFDLIERIDVDEDPEKFEQMLRNYGMQYPVFNAVFEDSGKSVEQQKTVYEKVFKKRGFSAEFRDAYFLFFQKSEDQPAIKADQGPSSIEITIEEWQRKEFPDAFRHRDEQAARNAYNDMIAERRKARMDLAKKAGTQALDLTRRVSKKLTKKH